MASKHKFDIRQMGTKRECPGGTRILLNSKKFPLLKNLCLATLFLKKGGVREPHWHPNADELAYCVEGKALVTIFSPGNNHDTFTLSPGEVFIAPKSYIHHIENIHSGPSRFIVGFSHHAAQDLDLSGATTSMTPYVLSSTFGGGKEGFKQLRYKDVFISQRKTIAKIKPSSIANHYKFNLERIHPQVDTKGGSARILNKLNFPSLENIALFSLRLAKNGVREPHWHPNADELNYVVEGKARLTIYSPGGDIDTFDVAEGQGSYIPAGYFHHIENLSSRQLHMTVFFSNAIPNDLGLSGALSAYSEETLASIFSLDPEFFAELNKFQEDRMIVPGG